MTLGTVFNHASVLRTALGALSALPVRLLATVGPTGDPADLGPQPSNVQVERWVDQAEVLHHAAVVVSHAGSGTFLGALSNGIPQLCLPQAADQFRNTSGGVRCGAALGLPPNEVSPEAITASVKRLLTDASFRRAAGRIADEIRAMPTPEHVVSMLADGGY